MMKCNEAIEPHATDENDELSIDGLPDQGFDNP